MKILMFVTGAVLALLMYLQTQEIITINMDKLQRSTETILTGQIPAAANLMPSLDHMGIPLASSFSSGLVVGLSR